MNKIEAIIFDFDGVILESVGIKTDAFAALFKDYPQHLQSILAFHKSHGGMSRFEKFGKIYQDILCQPLSQEKKEELGRRFSKYVYQKILECPFVGGAQDFLEKYHLFLPLFIASGTPDAEMKSIVRDRGLEKYFKEVYGSPLKKKEIILKIMDDSRFKKQNLILVGDSAEDEEGARAAGIGFIWRTKENNPFEELEKLIAC